MDRVNEAEPGERAAAHVVGLGGRLDLSLIIDCAADEPLPRPRRNGFHLILGVRLSFELFRGFASLQDARGRLD